MHGNMQRFPQAAEVFVNSEIPVDNWEFSTLSTDFSTGVFHRQRMLWIFKIGSHKHFAEGRENPYFFGRLWFLLWVRLCGKIRT